MYPICHLLKFEFNNYDSRGIHNFTIARKLDIGASTEEFSALLFFAFIINS